MTKAHRLSTYKNILISGIASSAFAISFASSANAQTSDSEAEAKDQIVVTGSRIARDGFESLQPTSVVSSELLDLRAAANVADILNEQPGFGIPGGSPAAPQGSGSVGQNFVNFLGLGAQRTLTLVNTQRFPAGAAPQADGGLSVDLNAIPAALIDRIETIAIGGAPAYGADAIAGTVNIILKDDFEGLDVLASVGVSPKYGDGTEYRGALTWGTNFADDRGNFVVAAEYNTRDGLLQDDRERFNGGMRFVGGDLLLDPTVAVDSNTGGPLLTLNGTGVPRFGIPFTFNTFGNGVVFDPTDPSSPLAGFDADGNLVPFVLGAGGSPVWREGGDGLDVDELNSLYVDSDRVNITALGHYDISDTLRVKAEAWFAQTDATQLSQQPSYNSPAFAEAGDTFLSPGQGPIGILFSNPFVSAATGAHLDAALNTAGIAGNNIDTDGDGTLDARGFYTFGGLTDLMGANPNSAERNTYRGLIGLEGEFEAGGNSFDWDLTAVYGQTTSADSATRIITPRFEQALQVTTNAAGEAVCVDQSNGCAPVNIIGTSSDAARNFVTALVTDRTAITQKYIQGNVTGNVYEMPAGPVGIAAGFTYREEDSEYNPNPLDASGLTRSNSTAISGGFSSTEFYGETVVPLLGGDMDIALVEKLEFEGALRFVDNSVSGSDVTWTAGGRYQPVSDIEFRGNYTQAIRAPSIKELFLPTSTGFFFANDPCDSRFINLGNSPVVRQANCTVAGLPANFSSAIVDASQRGTVSGNANLGNEKAKSWTIGAIIRPSFMPGLTASVDWMDIRITDAIQNLSAVQILDACYDSASFPNEPSCNQFTRDAAGQVVGIATGFVNVANRDFKGLKSSVSYSFDLADKGDLSLRLNHIYTDTLTTQTGGAQTIDLAGTIGNSKHRVNGSATWTMDEWRVFGQARWISSAVFLNAANNLSINNVDSYLNIDAGVDYQLNDKINLQISVDNLFNSAPPYPSLAAGAGNGNNNGIVTYLPGVLERFVTFTVRGSF